MIWTSLQPVADGKADLAWVRPSQTDLMPFSHVLSEDERARAARFLNEADRKAFIAGRIVTRLFMGERTAQAPHSIRFAYSEHGRPSVADAPDFSISHSGDHVVVAIARDYRTKIGIDAECHDRVADLTRIERMVLTVPELAWLDACEDRRAGFLQLWVMKEAVLKAAGTGLSTDPRLVCINPQNAGVRWIAGAPYGNWQMHQIDIQSGVAVALALCEPLAEGQG